MSQRFEKPSLGLDETGSYWIFYSTTSVIIVNQTGPSINLEEGFGGGSELLWSETVEKLERLEKLDARHFEESWSIDNFQAFEEECEVACAHRLGIRRPPDLVDRKRDWISEDIKLAREVLCTTNQTRLQEKTGPMSKRRRSLSPDPPVGAKRRHPEERDSSDLRRPNTYRPREYDRYAPDDLSRTTDSKPRHDRHEPEAMSQKVEARPRSRGSSPTAPSSPPARETHSGVGRPRPSDRLEQPKEPVRQLRQGYTSTAVGPSTRQHDDSDYSSRRPSEDDGSLSHTSSTNLTHDYSGISRGFQHRGRLTHHQRQKYNLAVDRKHPDVIPPMDPGRVKKKPYIFVSSSDLPFNPATIPHLQRMVGIDSVKADMSGYYILFSDSESGRRQMHQCHERFDQSLMFREYRLHLQVNDVSQQHPLSNGNRNPPQEQDGLFPRFERRVNGPHTTLDDLSASHPLARADDEMSMTGALAPSEISSGATRARMQCAECKSGHFASYNPKIGCSTCQRHYHLDKCLKPPFQPNENR